MKKHLFTLKLVGVLVFLSILLISCKKTPELNAVSEGKALDSAPSTFSGEISNEVREKVLKDYFASQDGQKSFMLNQGKGILKDEAAALTTAYYQSIPPDAIESVAKSVYFESSKLNKFMEDIKNSGLCTGTIGFRFYFAKYPAISTSVFKGQTTVIMRATCDGKDIPHQITGGVETVFVAFNYGDVCPPLCDISTPTNVYSNGRYNPNGNCFGCPQQ